MNLPPAAESVYPAYATLKRGLKHKIVPPSPEKASTQTSGSVFGSQFSSRRPRRRLDMTPSQPDARQLARSQTVRNARSTASGKSKPTGVKRKSITPTKTPRSFLPSPASPLVGISLSQALLRRSQSELAVSKSKGSPSKKLSTVIESKEEENTTQPKPLSLSSEILHKLSQGTTAKGAATPLGNQHGNRGNVQQSGSLKPHKQLATLHQVLAGRPKRRKTGAGANNKFRVPRSVRPRLG